jgi:hypothetical protein
MRGLGLKYLKEQEVSPEDFEKYKQQWIDEVQPLVGKEKIEAVGMFRHGGAVGKKIAGRAGSMGGFGAAGVVGNIAGGLMARGAAKKAQTQRAGGLPERVMLAVTPKKVYAFDYSHQISRKAKEREGGTPTEAAVWDRKGLECSAKKSGTMTTLTIESHGEASTLTGGSAADDAWSREVMQALGAV